MTLAVGDIAIVSMNSDTNKIFAFVSLVDIPAGEVIKFTDNGWRNTNVFRTGEGITTWTAPVGGVAAGTVVTIDTTGNGSATTSAGTVSESGDTNMSTGGDQLLAYQGAEATPTFLFAVNNDGANVWQADATSSNTSAVPAGLADGTNAVALTELDNYAYTGTTTGTRAELLAAIANRANWTGNDTTNQTAPAAFTVNDATVNGTAGSDTLSSGGTGDVVNGLDGNDILSGGSNAQTLDGGTGTDTASYAGATAGVTVRINRGDTFNDGFGGVDTLISIENATGSAFDDILVGDAIGNVLNGGTGRDVLVALGGNDTLIGGTGVSNELYGGSGDDTYVVSATDTIVEAAAEGTDLVQTDRASFRLGANVENLTYTGVASFFGLGNGDANVITGGTAADNLTGGAGNDTLIGGTGAANTLIGGLGDDTYVVSANDTVLEVGGEGTDTVQTDRAFHTLRANVENLTYTGSGVFQGTGNAENNVITGGAGNDTLIGGQGNDTLNGGAGTADYIVLQGVVGDYTVTDLGGGSYSILDAVAGRDGTDTTVGVERVRFASGPTASLASLAVGPAPLAPIDKGAASAQVLPGLAEDDFLMGKGGDLPLVLPDADDDGLATDFGALVPFRSGLVPAIADDGMQPSGSGDFNPNHHHDGWLF